MADASIQSNDGGQYRAAIATGTTEVVVSTTAGRLCKLVYCAAGTAGLEIYDSSTTSTAGTLVFATIATATAGTVVTLDIPLVTGIVVKRTTGTPTSLVTYNKNGTNGYATTGP